MKRLKNKDIAFFDSTVGHIFRLDLATDPHSRHVKTIFQYFGYEMTEESCSGALDFTHKCTEGNKCHFMRFNGFIGQVTFYGSEGIICIRPKTWQGFFNGIRNHTRRLIAMREAQYKPKAV
ncbi:hypothetical protein GCM10007423_39980 [Dyadobacter endophyticus]|uniref:Uncharacterized protein n=1 Tax=Dyadobacter endophyticus TaxID=1749036 RepID=A0ABQ1Z0T8_9BACT|nr:hypothetical protein [Dyadobacter endophyticus]GGH42961.1 hypothetical protein GCM10007423_39980 [Dyadobacter endophyticus]